MHNNFVYIQSTVSKNTVFCSGDIYVAKWRTKVIHYLVALIVIFHISYLIFHNLLYSATKNLLTNPGFEQGIVGWTEDGYDRPDVFKVLSYGETRYIPSAPSADCQLYCAYIKEASYGFVYQVVQVKPNTEYTIGAWLGGKSYKSNGGKIRFDWYRSVDAFYWGDRIGEKNVVFLSPGTGNWAQNSAYVTSPAEALSVKIGPYVEAYGNYHEYFDNVYIGERDRIPPGKISDLTITAVSNRQVNLCWTTPGDNGPNDDFLNITKTSPQFVLKYSTYVIVHSTWTEYPWSKARNVTGEPTPNKKGEVILFTVSPSNDDNSLPVVNDIQFYFALKTVDDHSNQSEISNFVYATPKMPQINFFAVNWSTPSYTMLTWEPIPN
ncbi:MAG: hypothetical protein QME68_07100, partial [Elusimicrobiota bacterium]|nr:hypothetical protein [Elusimicrobiota bacterium]